MRLYVLDSGKKKYLQFNKHIRSRNDIPYYFDIERGSFSRNEVIAEPEPDKVINGALIGGMIGFLAGVMGVLIGAVIGAVLGANEDFKELQRIKDYYKDDF